MLAYTLIESFHSRMECNFDAQLIGMQSTSCVDHFSVKKQEREENERNC